MDLEDSLSPRLPFLMLSAAYGDLLPELQVKLASRTNTGRTPHRNPPHSSDLVALSPATLLR